MTLENLKNTVQSIDRRSASNSDHISSIFANPACKAAVLPSYLSRFSRQQLPSQCHSTQELTTQTQSRTTSSLNQPLYTSIFWLSPREAMLNMYEVYNGDNIHQCCLAVYSDHDGDTPSLYKPFFWATFRVRLLGNVA